MVSSSVTADLPTKATLQLSAGTAAWLGGKPILLGLGRGVTFAASSACLLGDLE